MPISASFRRLGKRYKIDNVTVNSQISDVQVKPLYDEVLFKKGDWYNAELVEKSVYAITDELGKKGFAFVDVVPNLQKNTRTGELDVTFDVREGDRIFVDRINIHGNTRTHDEVIRREFRIDEGDAFNPAKIRASRKNIENLDYFSMEEINTVPPDHQKKAHMDVKVEEKSTGYFNVGVGYSTVNGALIRAGVTENNFQGKGQQLGLDVGVSQRTSDYNISFTEPYFLGRRLSAGADLFRTEQDYQDEGSYAKRPAAESVWAGTILTICRSMPVIRCVRTKSAT